MLCRAVGAVRLASCEGEEPSGAPAHPGVWDSPGGAVPYTLTFKRHEGSVHRSYLFGFCFFGFGVFFEEVIFSSLLES